MKNRFTNIQLDALKEVSNIGAGNGATSLSVLLGRKIDMTVPSVNIVKLDDVIEKAGELEVVAILVKVLGDIRGSILIEFEKQKAIDIASRMVGVQDKGGQISEMELSALCEIGNIVSTSYMNAIAKFTNLEITPSVPGVANDMLGSILTMAFVDSGQYDEYILDIETVFLDENSNNLGAHFYYIPEPGSLEKILKTIGIK